MEHDNAIPPPVSALSPNQDDHPRLCCECSMMSCDCKGRSPGSLSRTSAPSDHVNITFTLQYAPMMFQDVWTRQERAAFEFFRLYTAPNLPGVMRTGPETGFWSRWLLQALLHDTALKHAVCAVGALHESLSQQPQSTSYDISLFAYQQHTLAIKAAMSSMKHDQLSPDVSLVICILLTVFEQLTHNIKTAITHLQAGIRLARTREIDTQSITARRQAHPHPVHLPSSILHTILLRLESQLVDVNRPCTQHDVLQLVPIIRTMPYTFASFMDAASALEEVLNIMTHASMLPKMYVGPLQSPAALNTSNVLKLWSAAFESFLLRSNPEDVALNGNNQSVMLTLRTWQTIFRILTSRATVAGSMGFDAFKDDFAMVVRYSAAIVRAECSRVRFDQSRLNNSLQRSNVDALCGITNHPSNDINPVRHVRTMPDCTSNIRSTKGVKPGAEFKLQRKKRCGVLVTLAAFSPVHALCTVIHHCRDPAIRRSAIKLLDRFEWENGLFDSELATLFAERIMQLEESGALAGPSKLSGDYPITRAEQIPIEHRCDFVSPLLVNSSKIQVDFFNIKSHALLEKTDPRPSSIQGTFHGKGLIREIWTFLN